MPARDMVTIETQNDVDLPAETADERVRGAAKYCQIGTPAAKALFTQLLETWIAILITLRYSQLFALPWWCRWWSQCRLCVYTGAGRDPVHQQIRHLAGGSFPHAWGCRLGSSNEFSAVPGISRIVRL